MEISGTFLIMGNAGFIPSTVGLRQSQCSARKSPKKEAPEGLRLGRNNWVPE